MKAQDRGKVKEDLGGIKLVMFEYGDPATAEKKDFRLTEDELENLNTPTLHESKYTHIA